MKIAKIVSSNSHISYIARVLEERDGEGVPGPGDYGFGRFVAMPADDDSVVGVICDSRLVNPEYISYSSRTSSMPALGELRRDLVNEKKELIGILLLGTIGPDGRALQQIPERVVPAGQFVFAMGADEIAAFHRGDSGIVQLRYLANLLANAGSLAVPLAGRAIEQVSAGCGDEDRQRLRVMADALKWKQNFGDIRF